MTDRAPRQEQVEAELRRWAVDMIKALRPGDAEPAQLDTRAKIVRTYILPVVVQLTASRPPPVPVVGPQLPTSPPLTEVESGSEAERSGVKIPQLSPNFADCDPATLTWCGKCGALSDGSNWGFDRSARRPCNRLGCQLGRYRAYRVAHERGAEEDAAKEREAGTGPPDDPRVRAILDHAGGDPDAR